MADTVGTGPYPGFARQGSDLIQDYTKSTRNYTGTWNPSIEGATTAGVATYTGGAGVSGRAGFFSVIGNMCFCSGYAQWTAHTGTGGILIGGLPFPRITYATSVILHHEIFICQYYEGTGAAYLPNYTIVIPLYDKNISIVYKKPTYIYVSKNDSAISAAYGDVTRCGGFGSALMFNFYYPIFIPDTQGKF